MLVNWIIKDFFNKCNSKQHYEFMQLDRERGRILERLNDIEQLIEEDDSIDDNAELLQLLETTQQEYQAHCKKMNDYAYNALYA